MIAGLEIKGSVMPRFTHFTHWGLFFAALLISAAGWTLEKNVTNLLPKDAAQAQAIKQKADAGDAEAQYIVGMVYRLDVVKNTENMKTAIEWIRKSAEQGYAAAQNSLGMLYVSGVGLAQSDMQGFGWVQKAANSNDAIAQYNLSMMYLAGIGVKADENKAFELAKKASDQKLVQAQVLLAGMMLDGRGARQDRNGALALYRQAAQTEFPEAMYRYGVAMGSEEAKRKEAVIWIQKAARANFPEAQFMMGLLAYDVDNDGKNRDVVSAYQWFTLAAKNTKDDDLRLVVADALADLKKEMTAAQVKQGQAKVDTFKPVNNYRPK